MPDKKKTYQVLDQQPDTRRRKGESVEDYMARISYIENTVFPATNGKFINVDGNGDGVISPTEAINGLNNPLLNIWPKEERDRLLKESEQAQKQGLVMMSLDNERNQMHEIHHKPLPGGKDIALDNAVVAKTWLSAAKRDEFKAIIKLLDQNGDGAVTNGEIEYVEMQEGKGHSHEAPMQNLPAIPVPIAPRDGTAPPIPNTLPPLNSSPNQNPGDGAPNTPTPKKARKRTRFA